MTSTPAPSDVSAQRNGATAGGQTAGAAALAPPPFVNDTPSLDVIYEQGQWSTERALEQIDGIDTKVAAILSTSGFLFAGAAVLQVAIGTHTIIVGTHAIAPWWEGWARALAVGVAATLCLVLGLSCAALWPRTFTIAPDPVRLRDLYLSQSPEMTKAVVMHARIDKYGLLTSKIKSKTWFMRTAFLALIAEGLLLAAILVIVAFAL